MEKDFTNEKLEWSTIVEYFTKRGRPLTKDELYKQIQQDLLRKEREADEGRLAEEAEKRRMSRLMEELKADEDYETF